MTRLLRHWPRPAPENGLGLPPMGDKPSEDVHEEPLFRSGRGRRISGDPPLGQSMRVQRRLWCSCASAAA